MKTQICSLISSLLFVVGASNAAASPVNVCTVKIENCADLSKPHQKIFEYSGVEDLDACLELAKQAKEQCASGIDSSVDRLRVNAKFIDRDGGVDQFCLVQPSKATTSSPTFSARRD